MKEGVVPHAVMVPSLSVASIKPEAAIVRGQGLEGAFARARVDSGAA